MDTKGTETSVHFTEVSLLQRQGMYDFWHFWDQANSPLRGVHIIKVSVRRGYRQTVKCFFCNWGQKGDGCIFSCTGRGPITGGWAYKWQFTVARQNLWPKTHKDSPPNFNLVEGKVSGRKLYIGIQKFVQNVRSGLSGLRLYTGDSDVYASPLTTTLDLFLLMSITDCVLFKISHAQKYPSLVEH